MSYTVTDLGTLGGTESEGYGINASGQVVGEAATADDAAAHAVVWNPDGTKTDVGTLSGTGTYSEADGINASGQAAGYSYLDGHTFHAVVWNPDGSKTDLGTLGGANSAAYGINDIGQVVGNSSTANDAAVHAVVWNPDGSKTDLGTLGGTNSNASGINRSGQVVGYSATADDTNPHAVVWNPDGTKTVLGTLGGTYSTASGINHSGQVVGYSATASNAAVHGVVWNPDGTKMDLGTLGGDFSAADGINGPGQVVGYSSTAAGATHAVFWNSDGTKTDLNAQTPAGSGWLLIEAYAINDSGQIAGRGIHNGQSRAFLLTPVPLPDITPTSLAWSTTQGGVDFSYQLSGPPVPRDTIVALFWSSSDRFTNHLGGPIPGTNQTITAGTEAGNYGPFHIDAGMLGPPPPSATHLLAVTDPDNVLGNFNESTNVLAIAALPDIVMDEATTTDATNVKITYDVNSANINDQNITFDIYRSSTSNGHDILFATSTLDKADVTDLAMGHHDNVPLTLQYAASSGLHNLRSDPGHPYIVVDANADHSITESDSASEQNDETWFEKHLLVAIAHGFTPDPLGRTPAWETAMAAVIPHTDGGSGIIAFNWVSTSFLPIGGQAVAAGDRLYQDVVNRADELATRRGDVVDIQFVGHSRGAVVISQALQDLVGTQDPALTGGYFRMTMLDPHPANNSAVRLSASTPIGWILAAGTILFQAAANDPDVAVPTNVKEVDLYYQHNAARVLQGFPDHYLNLWGESDSDIQIPPGVLLHTTNLTGLQYEGFGYIGHTTIDAWYMAFVLGKTNIWG